jgi:hypothetical protein
MLLAAHFRDAQRSLAKRNLLGQDVNSHKIDASIVNPGIDIL